MMLANWTARIDDMKVAFLKEKCEDGEEIFIEEPQGMENHYWGLTVPRLLKPIYELKQAALLFWQSLLKIMKIW